MQGNPGLGQQASRAGWLKLVNMVDNWSGAGALNSQEEWRGQGRPELEQITGVGLGHYTGREKGEDPGQC